ncbi:MAG TPA: hypothetical protein VNI54_02605 [Thermoanaerobaculia bacterium]|nr:hypothetical protein [Thermoanaerobaculia bacterium]
MRILLIALLAVPAYAQLEMRGGVRAGIVDVRGAGSAGSYGGELWVARGMFAASAALDHYEAIESERHDQPNSVTVGAVDFNVRTRGRRYGWLGATAQTLFIGPDLADALSANAGFAWPWSRREVYVALRHHNAHVDSGRYIQRAQGVMLLVGLRGADFYGSTRNPPTGAASP